MAKIMSVKDAMVNIRGAFEKQEVIDRLQQAYLSRMRHQKIAPEEAYTFVKNIVAGIITTVEEDPGQKTNDGGKKYLWHCTPRSIVLAALDAVMVGIPVDNRKLAYLTSYASKCQYDLMYKGMVQKVQELYENADIRGFIVWDGDEFDIEEEDQRVKYRYKPKKPFRSDYDKAVGVVTIIAYTINGEPRERMTRIDQDDLKIIRAKAQMDAIWKQFTGEKMLVVCLRRALKLMAARNEDVAYLERVLNQHYDMALPALPAPSQLTQRLEQEKKDGKSKNSPDTGRGVPMPAGGGEDNDGVQNGDDGGDGRGEADSLHPGDQAGEPAEGEQVENGEVEPDAGEDTGAWDRKNVVVATDGRIERKTWKNSHTAAVFLNKKLEQERSKEGRQTIIEKNKGLLSALLEDGYAEDITMLYETVGKGEAHANSESDDRPEHSGDLPQEGPQGRGADGDDADTGGESGR